LWDQRLKDSGFNDIEDRRTGSLKTWAGNIQLESKGKDKHYNYGYSSLVWKESQAEYYRIASQCVHEAKFKTEMHKRIWELHSEGLTISEIAQRTQLTFKKTRYAIEQMAEEFGLKVFYKEPK
jgi:hypothetical protein